jgi:hypothetical protein
MNYESIDLVLSPGEARELVGTRVSGIDVRRFGDRYEFVSPLGYHLAELAPVRLPDGEGGSRLTYRTAMVSPIAANARRKASEIRTALADYRYDD